MSGVGRSRVSLGRLSGRSAHNLLPRFRSWRFAKLEASGRSDTPVNMSVHFAVAWPIVSGGAPSGRRGMERRTDGRGTEGAWDGSCEGGELRGLKVFVL